MAYAAVAKLEVLVENCIVDFGPWFSPSCLKLLEFALKETKSFQEFLKGLGGNTRKRMNASLRRFADEIHDFCDVVASHLPRQFRFRVLGTSSYYLEVKSLEQEFHVIFEKMKKIKEERFNGDADSSGNKSKMVGLSDVYNKLKREIALNRREYNTNIFLIFGMAGIGKTALAEAIFEDLDILEYFECRAWASVGKNCWPEEIPRRILAQLDPDCNRKLAEGFWNVETYFEEILKGKRYLIILDDVWDARVCSHLQNYLPKYLNGSRVILTSRSRHVAEHAAFISELRLLNEKESWILLREKVFGERSCPLELEKVGKKIADKCDGLPLTIIMVADLLLKIPESHWIDVATKRKHQLFVDVYDEISKVLYPSYEDLAPQFKLCFLYMAVFPPNFKISRSKLIKMWFIEGLLEPNTTISSEDCTDKYLEEFSSNSLIMVYQKRIRSTKETKTCGLHSSWWHLCYTEARKINFFYVLMSREDHLGEDTKSHSRLSIHNNILFAIKDVYDSVEKNSASSVFSLLCLGPYNRYPVPICFDLKLLKTLDALNIRLYEFPPGVLELGELEYFAITCDGELPVSISKLQNLQFFIVRRHHNIKFRGARSYLPLEIWDMKELTHFQIMGSDFLDDLCGTILPNLSTLLDVSGHSCTKGIFERILQLKKLGIRIELALDPVEPFCFFDHISQLKKLEILKCVVVDPADHKAEFASIPTSLSIFPFGLKKLTLSGLGYPWEEMKTIASLPCLEVLKLRCNAFRGPTWEVEEKGFPKLGFLVIEDIGLIQWKVGRRSFKVLESISLKHCYKLKEVDWDFYPKLLNKIEIVDCNPASEYIIRKALLNYEIIPDNFSVRSSWEAEELKP